AGLLGVLVVIGGGWRCGWRRKVDAVIFLFGCDRWRLELAVFLLPVVNGDGAKGGYSGGGRRWPRLAGGALLGDGQRWAAVSSVVGDGVLLLSMTCSSVVGVGEDSDGRHCPSRLVMDASGGRRRKQGCSSSILPTGDWR
ncbi:hypothetical protein Dimus_024556, partial [Dionaea muscipula]